MMMQKQITANARSEPMDNKKLTRTALAAALFGAVSASAITAPTDARAADRVQCYGIAKAGENACHNAAGTHTCAGQSTIDYDGGAWTMSDAATCTQMGGSTEPFEGVNEKLAQKPTE
ncbi:MAG: hypothetical protein Alpg2KO_26600 [Alphaproteobacteria bacterium]